MTAEEKKVIQYAFNLVDSVIAGDYKLPPEMCWTINNIQDAVHELMDKKKIKIDKMLTPEYVEYRNKARKERWEKILNRVE